MWARVVEVMIGCWLAMSPFIFRHGDHSLWWAIDFTAAGVVVTLAVLSYWPPMRYAHLAIAGVGTALALFGRFATVGDHPPAALQNHILVGLLLIMFAIIPNNASQAPPAWYSDEREPVRRS